MYFWVRFQRPGGIGWFVYDVSVFYSLSSTTVAAFCTTKMRQYKTRAYVINTQFQGDYPHLNYRIFTDGVQTGIVK